MANKRRYDRNDFELYKQGAVDIKTLANKYETSVNTIRRAMNRDKVFARKTRIKIITPYKTLIVDSKTECAYELKVGIATVYRALSGYPVKMFEDMGISLEVVE